MSLLICWQIEVNLLKQLQIFLMLRDVVRFVFIYRLCHIQIFII